MILLATLLYEIHTDIWNAEVCPNCPNVVMCFIDTKPALVCPQCCLSVPALDLRTMTCNDTRENNNHPNTFQYTHGSYFFQWVKRVVDNSKTEAPKPLLVEVYYELYRNQIYDVSQVTWCLIDEILRNLSKNMDANISKYYNLVFSITQTIRRTPILPLNIEDIKELRLVHRKIQHCWVTNVSKKFRVSNFFQSYYIYL